jgi:hypothetical protein
MLKGGEKMNEFILILSSLVFGCIAMTFQFANVIKARQGYDMQKAKRMAVIAVCFLIASIIFFARLVIMYKSN